MALGLAVAADIANMVLTHFIRGPALSQTMQDKPLLQALRGKQKSFAAGKDNVNLPVRGAYMSDTAGFYSGYTEDEQLVFRQSANVLRVEYPWREGHAGLIITWTELKKAGITVDDEGNSRAHTNRELDILTDLLQERLGDYAESWSRSMNDTFWRDGSQDAQLPPGVLSFLTPVPAVGITGGLNRATYPWFRHRYEGGIVASAQNQTLTKKLRSHVRQLRRYGGRPALALCGSAFIEALELELHEKGIYTQEGFANEGRNDLGMAKIKMLGLGTFDYDPTLDDLGLAKSTFVMDLRRLCYYGMEGETNRQIRPDRPYDYLVFLRSMTETGAVSCNQLNAQGRFEVA